MSGSITLKAPAKLTAQERRAYFRGLLLIMAADANQISLTWLNDQIEAARRIAQSEQKQSGPASAGTS